MNLKSGVIPTGTAPELIIAMMIVNEVYKAHGHSLTITSIADGRHSKTSLHYIGHAFDCRTRMLKSDEIYEIVKDISSRLTTDYDVVVEDTHLHIEYQPKRP